MSADEASSARLMIFSLAGDKQAYAALLAATAHAPRQIGRGRGR